jgi:hypothetical protein
MPDRTRGNTGKLSTGLFRSPAGTANEIYYHQRRAEGLAKYAPLVVPLLKELLESVVGDTPGYGVDDNLDEGNDGARYGWRVFAVGSGEARFLGEAQYVSETPEAGQRKTLLAVELLFGETGSPVAFLVDTRRSRMMVRTGLLGLKQHITVTDGATRKAPLSESDLRDALTEMASTMER